MHLINRQIVADRFYSYKEPLLKFELLPKCIQLPTHLIFES
jgi:hypothetical protein